jgi:hypothetical protein
MAQINQPLTTILAECPQENLTVEYLLIVPVTSSTDSFVIAASQLQKTISVPKNFDRLQVWDLALTEQQTVRHCAHRTNTLLFHVLRARRDDRAPSHALPSFLSCRDDMMDAVL